MFILFSSIQGFNKIYPRQIMKFENEQFLGRSTDLMTLKGHSTFTKAYDNVWVKIASEMTKLYLSTIITSKSMEGQLL